LSSICFEKSLTPIAWQFFPWIDNINLEQFAAGSAPRNPGLRLLASLYNVEWKQQHFQYYDIQSLDIIQMPREPLD